MKKKDSLRSPARTKRVKERLENFALLLQLSRILNSTLDHQEVKRRAIEATTQLLKAEVGSLLLIDEEKQELYFEVALGEKEEIIKTIHLHLGEGIAGWVAQQGESVIVNAPEQDLHFSGRADGKTGFKTRNIVCTPVKIKGKMIGVLEAINKQGKEGFDTEDLSLLSSLSDFVAIALDNARLYQELEEMFFQTAESLADAIEKRDPYTGGHTQRVTAYSLAIARHLALDPAERKCLRIASVLHDVGKIGIEDHILKKPGRLDEEEYSRIQNHPELGAEIIQHIRKLREVIPGVRSHHEQMNGSGYPSRLKGEDIPMIARIVAVADTYDAMTTDRPYRKALEKEMAVGELRRGAGTQFDAHVVDAFLKAYQRGDL